MLRRAVQSNAFTLLCLLALAAASAGFAAAADDDDDGPGAPGPGGRTYPIKLTRPFKAGQRYHWSADATLVDSARGTKSGQVRHLLPETVSVNLEATVDVLAVNADGEIVRMACTIEQCTARYGKDRKVVLRPGRVVTVEAGKWRPMFIPDAGSFTIEDDILLRSVLTLPRIDDTTDDDVFGTPRPQKVGDSWPINPDQMMKSWAAAGYKLKKQNISGKMQLKSAETIDGVECIRVSGRAKIEHFLPPAMDIPDDAKVADATTEIKFTRLVPLDASRQALTDSYSMTVHTVMKSGDGAAVVSDAKIEGKLLTSVGVKLKLISG
jgi:hypothetical protein